jgi:hypothetical protein
MPITVVDVRLSETAGRTLLTVMTTFPSMAAMERLLSMRMDEGLTEAVSQMDAPL